VGSSLLKCWMAVGVTAEVIGAVQGRAKVGTKVTVEGTIMMMVEGLYPEESVEMTTETTIAVA